MTFDKNNEIIMKGSRIVIPEKLQKRATQLAHIGHQGIEKTKSLLREKIWYPKIDQTVRELIDTCIGCQAVGRDSQPEPMQTTPTSDIP